MGKAVKKVRPVKTEILENVNENYWVYSDSNINLGNKILEWWKTHSIDEKTYLELKQSIFFKKWAIILSKY